MTMQLTAEAIKRKIDQTREIINDTAEQPELMPNTDLQNRLNLCLDLLYDAANQAEILCKALIPS